MASITSSTDSQFYYAPKLSKTWGTWAKIIAARIFFPPILLWDVITFIVNALVGEAVGKIVLPAQNKCDIDAEKVKKMKYNNNDLIVKEFKIVTHDNARLDTLQITKKDDEDVPNRKKYIINFVGNATCYEDILDDMISDARALKCNVIGFNLRGVGRSTGKPQSKNDLVIDGIAQVQRLLDDGVSPENIILKGHSLGASVATLVADHFHDHERKVNIFNGRSFSTITNVIVGQIRTAGGDTGHQETFGKKILGWFAKPFIKFGVALVKWEIDAGSAYKKLPDDCKEYMVVRSSKEERNKYGHQLKDDLVIPHYASLHMALKDERKEAIAMTTRSLSRSLFSKAFSYEETSDMFRDQNLKRKVVVRGDKESNAHCMSMDKLDSRYSYNKLTIVNVNCIKIKDGTYDTGNDVFRDFFNKR